MRNMHRFINVHDKHAYDHKNSLLNRCDWSVHFRPILVFFYPETPGEGRLHVFFIILRFQDDLQKM